MKAIRLAFSVGYTIVAVLFFCCGVTLVVFAGVELWGALVLEAAMPLQERSTRCSSQLHC